MSARPGRMLLIAAAAVIVATLIASYVVLGPPGLQRMRKLDANRVADLCRIDNAVHVYAKVHKTLPSDFAAMSENNGTRFPPKDPLSQAAYEYQPTGKDTYRLCANFQTDSASSPAPDLPAYSYAGEEWPHNVGRKCFDRRADLGT